MDLISSPFSDLQTMARHQKVSQTLDQRASTLDSIVPVPAMSEGVSLSGPSVMAPLGKDLYVLWKPPGWWVDVDRDDRDQEEEGDEVGDSAHAMR